MATKTNFNSKLNKARKSRLTTNSVTRLKSDIAINDQLRRESVAKLTGIITRLGEELNLDAERLQRSIKMSRKSAYGRIPELIAKIASIYAWPLADNTQASEIDSLQETVLDTLASEGIVVDGELLLDIKEAKGFNSFLDDATFEVVEGIEPEYDELKYYLLTFADSAKLPIVDYKMNETVYNRLETKALNRIAEEKQLAEEALARHQEMVGAGA